MNGYSETMKARTLARLLRPGAASASEISRETGISQATLSRWLKAAATIEPVTSKRNRQQSGRGRVVTNEGQTPTPRPKRRTGADKLALVSGAAGLEGEDLGAFLRREGAHLDELNQWRKLAEDALNGTKRLAPSKETRRLKAELARKDKALAETAALIVLKKKVAAIWGDEDDDTESTNDR
jgi:transposase